jgi:hypothetical protein
VRSEVQIFPGPPFSRFCWVPYCGAIAQLGERLLCKQEVVGSIPSGSTSRDFDKLVRRNEIRVRSHYGLARAKGSRELRRRVLSDIVKRRSFRVSDWPQAGPVRTPGTFVSMPERGSPRRCFVGLLLDRRKSSVRSCKLVFLISDHVGAALNKPAPDPCCRVRNGH